MIKLILLILSVLFFAVNMGASGVAPSFASLYGAGLIKRSRVLALFTVFVIFGAVILGKNVSMTLGRNLLPEEFLSFDVALVVLISASTSLFIANILKIPQSTSQVSVGAVVGAGLYFKHIVFRTLFFKIIPMWIILPLLSYFLTYLLYKKIYPPRHGNLYIYEKIFANEKKLKLCALVVSCYVAFAIGSNNVANAVGPMFGAGIVNIMPGLIMVAPVFGLGAWLLGKGPLETAGQEIVPLGIFSGTLASFVTATLLIAASVFGVPQSLVQLNLFSVFAVSCLKNGHKNTIDSHIIKKTFLIWVITPLISMCLSYLLLFFSGAIG